MANIGLRHFKYSVIVDDKYTGSNKMVGAIESKPSINVAEAELYADDTIAEKVSEFTKGSISLVITDDDDKVFAPLLGHKIDTETQEVIKTTDDIAPFVGFGRVIVKYVNGAKKYKAEFFPKIQFKPFTTDGKTKGENIEFQTPTIEGTLFTKEFVVDGVKTQVWERHKTFDTDEDAQAYLDELMALEEE